MNQTVTVEQLAERVGSLEQEVVVLKHDLAEIKFESASNGSHAQVTAPTISSAEWGQAFRQLFNELGITAQAKGVAHLRKMYKEAGIENLNLSRQLIEARDE
jgi:uncharacterized protein (UPF0335 family)